jgi:hypothetical protein
LYTVAQDAQGQISNRLAAGLGLALGVMIAVMINFVPWLVTTLIFIILSNRLAVKKIPWKKNLITGSIVLLACAAGFLVSILPSIQRMPYFFGFIYNLFTHQLRYGTGPGGITSIALLWSNLHDMVTTAPLIFLVMVASLLISLFIYLGVEFFPAPPVWHDHAGCIETSGRTLSPVTYGNASCIVTSDC